MGHYCNTPKGQLFLGECIEEMKLIEPGSIDLILTDPPYGTTACKWDTVIPFEPMWEQLKRIIKPNGAIVLFGGQPFTSTVICSNLQMFKYCWVWEKPRGTGFLNAKKQPMRHTEDMVVFYNQQPTYNPQKTTGHKPANTSSKKSLVETAVYGKFEKQVSGGHTDRYPKNIQRFNSVNAAHSPLHPTQKPVPLMEYLIKTYTNEGETVLDFTCGSGSTGVACENTNRKYILIDNGFCDRDGPYLHMPWVEVARQRIVNT